MKNYRNYSLLFRYRCTLTRLPSNCDCGNKLDIQHVLSSKKRGFVSLRQNHIRNITSILLKDVCKEVRVEPQLQQLTGEYLQHSTAPSNEVRLDIGARGFGKKIRWHFQMQKFSTQTPNDMQVQNSPKLMKSIKKSKGKHVTNAFFRSSMEVSHLC